MQSLVTLAEMLELVGLAAGLLCVVLLIRQNLWTWPVGIVYVLVSLVLFAQQRLYGQFVLHLAFLAMNGYGWWCWLRGRSDSAGRLPVTVTALRTWSYLGGLTALGIVVCGWGLARFTDAARPWWDGAVAVLSLAAMWLSSHKKIENWHLWLVIDVLATGLFLVEGMVFYTLLYFVYVGMAVAGYLAWKRALEAGAPA